MGNKTVNDVMQKMIAYSEGNLHDIAHFMKVYAFARTIGVAENLTPTEQETVEIAAILHDIACPLCRDYQILLEADFLVNADESHMGAAAIRNFRDHVFKTATGTHLLETIYRESLIK